jgi:hypothetical protein
MHDLAWRHPTTRNDDEVRKRRYDAARPRGSDGHQVRANAAARVRPSGGEIQLRSKLVRLQLRIKLRFDLAQHSLCLDLARTSRDED